MKRVRVVTVLSLTACWPRAPLSTVVNTDPRRCHRGRPEFQPVTESG